MVTQNLVVLVGSDNSVDCDVIAADPRIIEQSINSLIAEGHIVAYTHTWD